MALVALGVLLIGFVVIAVLGWRGRLYGCRKRRAATLSTTKLDCGDAAHVPEL